MPVFIRPYDAADAPALAQLRYDSVRQAGARFYTPEQVAVWAPAPSDPAEVHARACDGRQTLVAIDDAGAPAGYGDLEPDGHLDFLYCRPDVVGAGVGSALVEALIALATAQGSRRIYVEASEGARPLFERKGFTLLHRRDLLIDGVAIHNYAMEKVLG